MVSLKRNLISIFGWFIFVILFYFLSSIFEYIASQMLDRYSSFIMTGFWALAAIFLAVFILGFLAFAISLKAIVFPISRRNNLSVANSRYPLILEWLTFVIIFVISFWPLGLVEDLIKLMTTSPTITSAVVPTWELLVSLWLYRENVLAFLPISKNQPENTELQVQNAI